MILPTDVQTALSSDEQTQWLAVYASVFAQTGDDEKATLAAWGSVRRQRVMAGRSLAGWNAPALRLDITDDGPLVKGWGMLFSDATQPDLIGTHFSNLTDLLTEYYPDAPLWYEHGWDADYRWSPIGKRHRIDIFPYGIWAEHLLWLDHALYARTQGEIQRGELAYSSDSIAHYYEQGLNQASGEVRAWPLAGWSLTKRPAEPGLGPVTLDGISAAIQEVVEAPARRVSLDDGRATLTLTACKTVVTEARDDPSQDGPTVPADNPESDPDSEAREAQESITGLDPNGAAPDAADTKKPSDDESPVSDSDPHMEVDMDPELLNALAEFFGVEETPEAVRGALNALVAGETEIDVAALRSALEMDDDAPDDDVVAELTGLADLLEVEPDPEQPAHNFRALRTARTRALALADATPLPSPVPTQVPTAASRSLRHTRGALPNTNFNEAHPPGLIDAIYAGLGQRGPNMRSDATLSAIRSDLFQLDQAARAADSGSGPAGAFVLNRGIAATILDPLREQLVLQQAGATYIPMAGIDTLTIRKLVGVPGAYWAAENTAVEGDDATWAIATLMLKELRAPTRWPNRWLRHLPAGADQQILNEIVRSMRLKMEWAALFGDGSVPTDGTSTGQQPTGIRHTQGINLVTLSPERLPTIEDLETAVGALEDANVEETETWGWLAAPRTFRRYSYKKDANGQPILRNSWADGPERTLVDYTYHKTTAISVKQGGGSASSLFFGDWAELLFGMGMDVELLVSAERYIDQNQTFVMGVAYVDTALGYPEAFSVTEGIL